MKAFFDAVRGKYGKLSQSQVSGFEIILAATQSLDLRYRAYLLATAWHETAFTMQPIYERGGRSYFSKYEPGTTIGRALGNTEQGDGYKYRGRGYVQLTGRANYRKAGSAVAVDLIRDPDAALRPVIAARILVQGCMGGWFTGKKLSDYSDHVNMRRVVNGTDKAVAIAEHAKAFEAALLAVQNEPAKSVIPKTAPKPSGPIAPIFAGLVAAVGAVMKYLGIW